MPSKLSTALQAAQLRYHLKNKEARNQSCKEYSITHKAQILERKKIYYQSKKLYKNPFSIYPLLEAF